MNIKEIYEAFNSIGSLTFATVNENGEPVTRIAHLRGYDDDGIYFMTMFTKSFYTQLKSTGKLSICGLAAENKITHNSEGLPIFEPGYAINMTGDVKEISIEEIKNKQNKIFDMCIKDQERYKAMVVFCITSGNGEIFDYDFQKTSRENKLERKYFAYNGRNIKYKGLHINTDKCINCGICKSKCSFLAITKDDDKFVINKNRCDECGDCYINCPVQAIELSNKSRV